jgi:hypothetical protein
VKDFDFLAQLSETEIGGIGEEGYKPGYSAYADFIRIGNREFQDCMVSVMDSRSALPDADELIGMDVFSRFLVMLNYPRHKLRLARCRCDREKTPQPSL